MKAIKKREFEFLTNELDFWQSENLITPDLANNILNLYELKKRPMRAILLMAGFLLLMLGCASVAVANWETLNQFYRFGIIFGGYIASLIAYVICNKPYSSGASKSRAGQACLLMGSFILIAGIFFVPSERPKFIIGLGYCVTAVFLITMIMRDACELYLLEFLAFLYLVLTRAINLIALQFLTNPAGNFSLENFFSPLRAFVLAGLIWLAVIFIRDRTAFNASFMISLALISSRMIFCFGNTWTLIILVLFGAAISFLSRFYDMMIFGLILSGVLGILLTWPEFWNGEFFETGYFGYSGQEFYPIVSAILIALLMIIQIYRGNIITGGIFFVLLAGRYFFDELFGYISKAWFFGIAGAIFLAAGLFSSFFTKSKSSK